MAKRKPSSYNKALLKKITSVISKHIRPYIQMDGGDIEILELTDRNVLKVRLRGACEGCPLAPDTLEFGVQTLLFEKFPKENIQVVNVDGG